MSTEDNNQPTEQQIHDLYRSLPRQQPPEDLDAKILAAAHAEVKRHAESAGVTTLKPRVRTWYIPLSMAAVVLISFSLVIKLVIDEQALSPDVQMEPLSATQSEAEQPVLLEDQAPQAARSLMAPAAEPAPQQAVGAAANRVLPPKKQIESEARVKEERFLIEQRRMKARAPAEAAGMSVMSADSAAVAEPQPVSPTQQAEVRVEQLLRLLEIGDVDSLQQQLLDFRHDYPDYPLPQVLLEWQRQNSRSGAD